MDHFMQDMNLLQGVHIIIEKYMSFWAYEMNEQLMFFMGATRPDPF